MHIPAFTPHSVENEGEEETAAVSFAFDTTALLIDLFRGTLERCLGRARPRLQASSSFGPRLWGSRRRWDGWRAAIEDSEAPILKSIEAELSAEVPEAAEALRTDGRARERLHAEWKALLSNPEPFSGQTEYNP